MRQAWGLGVTVELPQGHRLGEQGWGGSRSEVGRVDRGQRSHPRALLVPSSTGHTLEGLTLTGTPGAKPQPSGGLQTGDPHSGCTFRPLPEWDHSNCFLEVTGVLGTWLAE